MSKVTITISSLIACVLLPNLLWFNYSTSRITNQGSKTIESVTANINNQAIEIGTLKQNESHFIFLPNNGGASFEMIYKKGQDTETACQEYVEGSMYHVEVVITNAGVIKCNSSLPLISDLLILKLI